MSRGLNKEGLFETDVCVNKLMHYIRMAPGVFKPDYEPCRFRILESYICNQGRTKYRYKCKLKDILTTPSLCGECDDYEEH